MECDIFLNCDCDSVTIAENSFLYKACESLTKFVAHSDGKTIHIEILPYNHVLEIQSISAVTPECDRYKLAIEHSRIALDIGRRCTLDESVMRVAVEIIINHSI